MFKFFARKRFIVIVIIILVVVGGIFWWQNKTQKIKLNFKNMENFSTTIPVTIVTSIIVSYLTYYFALKRFHREKQYQDKFDKYQSLVDTMRGFVRGVDDQTAKQKFTDCYRATWLCGSPAALKLITKFYNTYIDRPSLEKNEKQKIMTDCLLEAVIEMRRDLGTQGKLKKIEDFDFYV